jgi:hypothetical protein
MESLIVKRPLTSYSTSRPSTVSSHFENLGAIKLQLTAADLLELDGAFARLEVHGGRMNEMRLVDTSV